MCVHSRLVKERIVKQIPCVWQSWPDLRGLVATTHKGGNTTMDRPPGASLNRRREDRAARQ